MINKPIKKLSREERLNPFPMYRTMRHNGPIHFNETRSSWEVFTYNEAIKILRDHNTFSSMRNSVENKRASILSMDQPRHTELRGLINRAFLPKVVSELEPRIREIANDLLDQVENHPSIDVVRDYAYPLPVIVIAELLGIPSEDREQFKKWSDLLVEGPEDMNPITIQNLQQRKLKGRIELEDYFSQIIEQHRKEPREDLVSALIAAEIDGEHLSVQELLNFCILLLAAGNETTTNLITNACRCFLENPETLDELMKDYNLIPPAMEETLRFYSPVQATNRIVKKDIEINGQILREEEQVIVWLGSANRDEKVFTNPEKFDIHRKPNHNLAFGNGIHFCLGAPLARLEAKITFEVLFERFKDFRFLPCELEPIVSEFVYGVKSLPIEMLRK